MIQFQAKNYASRQDLENEVRSKLGLTPDRKPDYEIVGTKQELKMLQLSSTNTFWGIICKELDDKGKEIKKPPNPQTERPQRGEIHKSKLEVLDIDKSIEL